MVTKEYRALIIIVGLCVAPLFANYAYSESVPDWVKNTALWYAEGSISETEFLNAIKFLVENGILKIEPKLVNSESNQGPANIIIPNGNSNMGNVGFYLPLTLEITPGSTVIWINDDSVGHTIQSQDGNGNVVPIFNSDILQTGERFAHEFDEPGIYNYFCTLHPWRVGVISVR